MGNWPTGKLTDSQYTHMNNETTRCTVTVIIKLLKLIKILLECNYFGYFFLNLRVLWKKK